MRHSAAARWRPPALALMVLVACAAPAAASCVGDCDGSNAVSIAEVQRAVNIFLRLADLSLCANADRDRNGAVTIDEVQAAVNSFLSDPATCPTVIPSPTPSATPTGTPATVATATTAATATSTSSPTVTATPLVPTATASATPSRSPSVTPSATPGTVCGNGVIEPGETCTTCAADCTARSCTATTPVHTVKVNLAIPADQTVSGLTLLVGYKSGTVSLPGTGAASTVGSRIKNKPTNTIFAYNDLDYALRTVLSRSSGFTGGQLYTIDFDSCQGAAAPTIANFACTVEGCSNTFGTVDGCTCSVSF